MPSRPARRSSNRIVPLVSVLSVALGVAACAGVSIPSGPGGGTTYPGFDTWQYPGDALMSDWRSGSPYRWVGYYLESPCHRDASWMGKRQRIEQGGWGIAVLYVGQQVFEGQSVDNSGVAEVLCSRTLLTDQQARADGSDAIRTAASEGFPSGSVIFLDVERVERIPPEMVDYLGAWVDTVLRDGRYIPGVYAHRGNAPQLYYEVARVFQSHGRQDGPPMWIAGGSGFSLERQASDAGISFINVWQGALDVQRSWAGRSLTIDENVADRPSPSAP